MAAEAPMFIGIDVGTQGVRAVAVDTDGVLVANRSRRFALEGAREEQSPEMWWGALLEALGELAADMKAAGPLDRIVALSVTSTSGTVIPLDRRHAPLHPALMYSDRRSAAEAEICRQAVVEAEPHPVTFNSSYGLPKILWYTRAYPPLAEHIYLWSHAGDYILGRLSGEWGVTDVTTALKTGFDPVAEHWPEFITSHLKLPPAWFPRVVAPGTVLGTLRRSVSEATGLPLSLQVVAGMTDGCASQVAAGAVRPGAWSTTIGTTMVIKGVTRRRIVDPLGRVYNHRHPQGYWMPGGASNTGADWIAQVYGDDDLTELDRAVAALIPTPWIAYPLQQTGERFPFLSPQAHGFEPEGLTHEQRYAARMEGVAYLERLAYELIESLARETVEEVWSAGGGSRSRLWLEIRSSVLGKPIRRLRHAEGAVGAAIIAASRTRFGGLAEAAEHMGQLETIVEPGAHVAAYAERYGRFVDALRARGYLEMEIHGEEAR